MTSFAALQRLEAALRDIIDDASLQLVELPNTNGLKLYLIDEHYPLQAIDADLQQKVMQNPLYWMFCWASGHAMARWIIDNPKLVKGKTVLDVGSGSGVVAIACALAGATKVFASDIDPLSQLAIALNASVNGCESTIEVVGDLASVIDRHTNADLDLCTIADVLYDADNKPLIDTLIPAAKSILLADSRLKDFQHPALFELMQQPGHTFPDLGGFDEFSTVRFFAKQK